VLKRILILAAGLVTSSALAADQAPVDLIDVSEKSICEAIGTDQLRCVQASTMCHWDPVDGLCSTICCPPRCGSFLDPAICNTQPGCAWDNDDPLGPRCENLG